MKMEAKRHPELPKNGALGGPGRSRRCPGSIYSAPGSIFEGVEKSMILCSAAGRPRGRIMEPRGRQTEARVAPASSESRTSLRAEVLSRAYLYTYLLVYWLLSILIYL